VIQAVDSNVFIYALDGEGALSSQARALLSELEMSGFVASQVVLTEVLCKPARVSAELGTRAREFLASFQRLKWVDIDAGVAERAAWLLAAHAGKLKPFDALHLASALQAGASVFWTNDQALAGLELRGLQIQTLGLVGSLGANH
jgi:predicted nucleic acid-binding protein